MLAHGADDRNFRTESSRDENYDEIRLNRTRWARSGMGVCGEGAEEAVISRIGEDLIDDISRTNGTNFGRFGEPFENDALLNATRSIRRRPVRIAVPSHRRWSAPIETPREKQTSAAKVRMGG